MGEKAGRLLVRRVVPAGQPVQVGEGRVALDLLGWANPVVEEGEGA